MNIYLDIETIGTEDSAVIDEIAAGILPPRTMSKPETIAKWEEEEKPALIEEAVRKTAFDGGLGRVICCGIAIDDGPVSVLGLGPEDECLYSLHSVAKGGSAKVVGHNVSWDCRFLWQRFVVNDIRPPTWLVRAVRAKPWEIEDTMLLWNPERDRRISLDRLCRALGIQSPKSDMDGSKVWDYWKAGRCAEISSYCASDVAAMRMCYLRMI